MSNADLPALSNQEFDQDARVLAYHGPMIYEAKVRETAFEKARVHQIHTKSVIGAQKG
jgi:23S rRNA maturation mini-RNase III